MKKMRNILIALGALAASLMTAACSDVHNTSAQTQNSAKSGITVSGSLSSGTGRSATSSLASDTITWKVAAATKGETGGPNYASAIFGSVSEDMTFTITLPEAGDYYFIATGYVTAEQETQVLQGKTDIINVTAEGRSNIVITAKPSSSEESGKISLPISDESGKIANILIYEDGDDSPCFEKSFLSREVIFAHENPTAGVHIYQFCFDDANGNTLYTCREAVTVFSSLTTDSWIGNAPYFVQNEDGTARFVITEELLTKYGTEVVPSTQTVLYERDTENGWSYSFANSDSLLDNASNQADFCFDSNGNVYLGTNNDVMQFYYYDGNSTSYISVLDSNSENMQITSQGFLDYDFAKNQLWFVTDGSLYKFSQLNENSSESPVTYSAVVTVYNFRTTDLGAGSLLAACIYNDKAYLAYSTVDNENVPFVLLEYDISSAVVDGDDPTQFSIETPKATKELCAGMDLSSSATITDMLYQDGAVYILARDYNFDNQYTKISRGAVLRYNTLTGNLDSLGFADAVDNASLANTKISAYNYTFNDNAYKPLFNDENRTTPWLVNANKEFVDEDEGGVSKIIYNELPGIFTPAITTSISTEQFYGPSKFVAVKPKKLVIADDGIAFYTDNDVLKYKNVNRIVTVDLNSFSIVGTEDVSAKFGGESSDVIELLNVSNSTAYQAAMADEDFPKYYKKDDGTSIELTSVAAGAIYLVAPCGD